MNGYNFTERVRHTLARAREHTVALGHDYVGTEHILLALLESGGVGPATLQYMNIDLEEAAELVKRTAKAGRMDPTRGPDLPYTSPSKKVLEMSMSEARAMNHSYVGTEHLLLGLLAEKQGVAAQVLNELGVQLNEARQQVLAIIGQGAPKVAPPPTIRAGVREAVAPPSGELPTGIEVAVWYSNGAVVRRSFTNRRDSVQFLEGL
jgi:ATP-dependent Clp protease ATP-binding subunit ClpC